MKKKKVLIPLIIVAAVIVFVIVMAGSFFGGFSNPAGDHQQVLKSNGSSAKAAMVIYQPTLSGATKKTAEQIAKGLNDAGYEVLINNPGPNLEKDVSRYSVVVFGSPVYAGKLSPVLLDYLKTIQFSASQKVILFDTGSVDDNGPELDQAVTLLNGAQNIEKVKFIVKTQGTDSKAYDLGKSA